MVVDGSNLVRRNRIYHPERRWLDEAGRPRHLIPESTHWSQAGPFRKLYPLRRGAGKKRASCHTFGPKWSA